VTALFIPPSHSKQRGPFSAAIGPGFLSLQSSHRSAHHVPIRLRKKPGHDLVELRELTKHTRRIPRCHTSRRDVRGDNAACTNYGAAADADAGKDDRL
jgi:hypothetical protein